MSNTQWAEPMLVACEKGLWDSVRLLISNGAKPIGGFSDSHGNTPLMLACNRFEEQCPDDIARLLLAAGNDLNAQNDCCGETIFHILTKRGRYASVAKVLLEYDDEQVDLNLQDNKGRTALCQACFVCCHSLVKMLLEDGRADVNVPDSAGCTPLHIVCRNVDGPCYMPLFHLLLAHGANVNAQDKMGNSPLLMVFRRWCGGGGGCGDARSTAVHRLLESGAELHHRNFHGDNALSTAAVFPLYGDREACQFLLQEDVLEEFGAVLSNQGAQALLAACIAVKPEIVRLLVQALGEQGMLTAHGVIASEPAHDYHVGGGEMDDLVWSDREVDWLRDCWFERPGSVFSLLLL